MKRLHGEWQPLITRNWVAVDLGTLSSFLRKPEIRVTLSASRLITLSMIQKAISGKKSDCDFI